jgi:hypothetical protein
MNRIANFIELPVDEYGNRSFTNDQAIVIRAEVIPGDGKPGTYGGVATLRVIEPAEFVCNFPTVKRQTVVGNHWVEVDNPAGAISESRYAELVTNIVDLPEWMYTSALERKAYEIALSLIRN